MPKIINTRNIVSLKRGRGIDGNRLTMCSINDSNEMEVDEPEEKKEQMNKIIDKLAKIKIINPKNGAKMKKEMNSKYISI